MAVTRALAPWLPWPPASCRLPACGFVVWGVDYAFLSFIYSAVFSFSFWARCSLRAVLFAILLLFIILFVPAAGARVRSGDGDM
jgi:hypothetical protein